MEYRFKNLSQDNIQNIVGVNDENIALLEELYGCGIVYRDNYFRLLSDDEELFAKFSLHLDYIVSHCKEDDIDHDFIVQSFRMIQNDELEDFSRDIIAYGFNGRPFKAKTANQARFIKAIRNKDMVFGIGPAGTGKTFLAVLMAVS